MGVKHAKGAKVYHREMGFVEFDAKGAKRGITRRAQRIDMENLLMNGLWRNSFVEFSSKERKGRGGLLWKVCQLKNLSKRVKHPKISLDKQHRNSFNFIENYEMTF